MKAELGPEEKQESLEVDVKEGGEEKIELIVKGPRGSVVEAGNGKTRKTGSGIRQGLWLTLGIPDGLPDPAIRDILQDRKGYLWMSTGRGAVRYDGGYFTVFTVEDGLVGNSVNVVLEDQQGSLWFGTEEGVSRYDGGRFTNFTVRDGLAGNHVFGMEEDREGNLWFATYEGVSRFDGQTFSTFTSEDGLASNIVIAVLEDRQGNLWFSTVEGTSRYDGRIFTSFSMKDGLMGIFDTMLEDAEGNIWFGNRRAGGVSRYDGQKFEQWTGQGRLTNSYIYPLLEDRKGYLWFGGSGGKTGVMHYDGEKFEGFTTEDGLGSNEIFSILEDREGHLWFGTGGGLTRYDGQQFEVFSKENGLVDNQVNRIFEDQQGRIWIGTSKGISQFDDSQMQTFTREDILKDSGKSSQYYYVSSILENRQGQVWFGTYSQGVSYFDGTGFEVIEVADLAGSIITTLMDRKDNLWIGTREGVKVCDGEEFISFTAEDGLAGSWVLSLLEDEAGDIWIGTNGGVSRYDGFRFESFTSDEGLGSNVTQFIEEDRSGDFWFFSPEETISRYDGSQFEVFTTEDGLGGGRINAVFEDRKGDLWVGTDEGVSRYDGSRFETFSTENGLVGKGVNAIVEDQKGHLWFGLKDSGISRYDGSVFQHLLRRDGLVFDSITDILQDSRGDAWIASGAGVTRYKPSRTPPPVFMLDVVTDRRHGPVEKVRLPTSANDIAFEFRAINFSSRPEQRIYVYRLKGHEENWQQTRAERVEYADLPIGEYAFQVKAVDRDLNYSEEPASVSLEVYYQPVSSSIRVAEVNIQDIFASFYKSYAEKPIGSVLVINDDPTQIEATLSFYLPDLMRRPTEQTVILEPNSSQIATLHAILDDGVLDLEGATPAQAEVALSCVLGEQTFSIQESSNIMVYGRGALTWDPLGRAAAFVTPEDHNVSAFSRSLFERYRSQIKGGGIDGNIPVAMLLFEALNAHGIKYAQDASTPYSQVRGDHSAVDNIQYPGELLQSKMGDCDDCTVLFCALLENLNVPTALVDAPDHIFMMFDSGVTEDRYFGFSLEEDLYVERDGRFWIPVEVTKLGEGSFVEAWELGARTCQRLRDLDAMVTDVREAWPEYPYALPSVSEEIEPPDSEELERSFAEDMAHLGMLREVYVERKYIHPLLEDPKNHRLRMQLAKTRIETENFNEAISTLMSLLDTDMRAEAYYFIGYSYAGKKNFEEAVRYVGLALEHDPENRGYRYSLEVLRGELSQ